jgi:ATP-dependent DNA helicase RecG
LLSRDVLSGRDVETLPLTALKGVGPKLAQKLQRLGLVAVQDLLFHLPFRYQDRTRVAPIGSLRAGQEAVVVGTIELTDVVFRGRRSLLCRISDGTGGITLRFFYFSSTQQANLERGRKLRCFGEVRFGPIGLEMVHPEYVLDEPTDVPPGNTLTPVYPATEGLHQMGLRKLIRQALDGYLPRVREWLPQAVLADLRLFNLQEALAYIHAPPADAPVALLEQGRHPAQQRLAFEELLAHHLSLRRLRARARAHHAPRIAANGKLTQTLLADLPFVLTGAQRRAVNEVAQDLQQMFPMQRLLQGDVGCGKTIVAAAASLYAIEAGFQVALMAPTELLAEQHWRNFQDWLTPLRIEVAWLSGKLKGKARAQMLDKLKLGQAPLAVGTHALFQDDVAFANLGLIIVDEQHRFGVDQRLALREKGGQQGYQPHQLIMSATPIPRTLAQTLYADLDVSIIDELPPGRLPVETVAIPAMRRAEVVQRVHNACLQGRQAYWVCPLIEESEVLQLQTARDTEAILRTALPELSISLIHGRMKPAEKEAVMAAFKAGEINLLVATTVIEVGVDVPNASLMIVENSERLGLSQLHQLRGRVGRGLDAASCVLMYQPPLSQYARARLRCLRETTDGFEIARKDLEMRGAGEMFGARQTGMPALHIADLARDQSLLPKVIKTADLLLQEYAPHVDPIIQRWLGKAEDYGNV